MGLKLASAVSDIEEDLTLPWVLKFMQDLMSMQDPMLQQSLVLELGLFINEFKPVPNLEPELQIYLKLVMKSILDAKCHPIPR